MHRERPFQAWVQVSMGCNSKCAYCIVPSVRGREVSRRPGEIVAEVSRLAARGRPRGHAPRPERQLVGPRPRVRSSDRVRRAPARLRRRRRDRAHPLHEPAPEGLPRAGDRRDGRVRRGVRAHPPAAPVRLEPPPQADAAHVRPRALPRPRRAAARRHAGSRARDGHHRRLPGRDGGRLPADARGRRGGALRQRLHLHLLAASRHRGGRRFRTRCPSR